MTISTTSNTVVVQGNGLTTSFDFTFPVPLASELSVYYTDTTGAVTTLNPSQYSVTGIGTANGGAVTYPLSGSPIATGTSLTIQRIVSYQQLTDLVNQSGYYPNVVENALDYLTMQTQQLAQEQALAIKVPLSASPSNLVLPSAAGRATTLVGFDSSGNVIAYPITASVGAGNLTSEGPFVAGIDFTAGVSTTLTLSKSYGAPANVQVHFDGIYQGTDQYTLTGTQITFTSPIPVGVSKVYIVGGTTLSTNVPADGSVTTPKIQDGAVTSSKIAAGAVGAAQLANGSIGAAQLAWAGLLSKVVTSISALRSLNKATYTNAFVTGYYTTNDGGGGAYYLDAADTTSADNGGTIIVATDGGRWKLIHNGTVSVKQFGAKGDSVTYDDVPVQAAVATGLSVHVPLSSGNYRLHAGITCTKAGQTIFGDGKDVSDFLVDATFNMSSTGVFIFATGESGPQLRDFGIFFVQPDTSVRANLTAYPPAIYAQATPRFEISDLKITNAMVGIDMRLNSGGAVILNLDISAYTYSIMIDGCLDTVRISGLHNWPFNMTVNQTALFQDPNTVGLYSGRCDDLHIIDSLFYCGTQLVLFQGGSGFTGGLCTGTTFDTNPNVAISAGLFQFSNCSFSVGLVAANAITITGSTTRVQMNGCSYLGAAALTSPLVSISGAGVIVEIVGCRFNTGGFDIPSFANSNSETILSSCYFERAGGVAYSQPTIETFGTARLISQGNHSSDKGAGSGTFISISADNYHNIVGNSAPGWTYSHPAFSTGVFANNI